MPIFEYKCEKCGHIFEQFHFGGSAEEAKSCPKCNAPEAKKIISTFASMFGGGSEGGCGGCGSGNKGFS